MSNILTDEQRQILADSNKSDQDILNELKDKQQEYEEALEDVMNGLINPLIVKGPPGVGKTESAVIASRKAGIRSRDLVASEFVPWPKEDIKAGQPPYPWNMTYECMVDGALVRTADYGNWQLVTDLNANADEGLLILDDNDDVLKNNVSMSILMNATEQKARREIAYGKAASTTELQIRGVPARFKTRCPIIILSNIDFDKHIQYENMKEAETGKPAPSFIKRWEALMHSRGKFLDLNMNSPQRIRIWCEDLIQRTGMLRNSDYLNGTVGRSLTSAEEDECLAWVRKNQPYLKSRLDLRTYNKVASKIISRGNTWQSSAKIDFLRVV
jgi:hypothetical protein